MAENTKISWAKDTWNPIVGCSVVSPGCTNCYAMKMAARLEAMSVNHTAKHGGDPGPLVHYQGTTEKTNGGAVWTGKIAMAPDHILTKPLRWKKPRKVFVNSMGDLFHENVPDEMIDEVFRVMVRAPQHTFQVLTKRSARMLKYVTMLGPKPLTDNIWLGVSAEDQERADERIPDLLATPAAVRFVSAEPLLGPILLPGLYPVCYGDDGIINTPALDWVITGSESGPKKRPMNEDWVRWIRDQCIDADVPFFFKQAIRGGRKVELPAIDGQQWADFPA